MIDALIWLAALFIAVLLIGLAELVAYMAVQEIATRRARRRHARRAGYVPFVR